MNHRIYADNAATSFPKPPEVLAAMSDYAQRLGASAGRGAYREAVAAGELLATCRARVARLIGAPDPRQIIFGLNCSEALNLALRGLLRPGDHVVTSRFEHNSVLRPLHSLAADGVTTSFVPVADPSGRVSVDALRAALRPATRLIALQHASNVTGVIQPVEEAAALARERDIPILVDAAQTAGHLPLDVTRMGIDLLAFPGHKGLLGPLGTGALYIRAGLAERIRPLVCGGTGTVSELPTQPDQLPDKYESGSHNAIGLAGLSAAAEWLLARGVDSLRRSEIDHMERFLAGVSGLAGLSLYGPRDPRQRVAVFSVRVADLAPAETVAILEAEFGVLARAGIHCAPWAHESLGTAADGGTTRLSFGPFTTAADIDACVAALAAVAAPANA
ncbi:MAG: aminotransferase class V-fold PLP-dependent enzyme [Phycisphaerae bacterium]